MKKWFFEFILYIFSFIFIDLLFKSMVLPDEVAYLTLIVILVGLGMMFSKSLLVFLTVRVVFLTRFFAMFLMLFGIFYGLEVFVPGFAIGTMPVQEVELSWLSLKSFEFDKISVMVLLAFTTALLSSLVKLLEE